MHFIFNNTDLSPLQTSIIAIFTYGLFSVCDAMGKWLQAEGFELSTILVITSLPSLVVLTLYRARKMGWKNAYKTNHPKLHCIRALCIAAMTILMFNALKTLPLADFYGVVFIAPLLITIGAMICFKERVKLIDWFAIIGGFVGVMIIVQPDYNNINTGYIYVIAQAFCIMIAALAVRKIGRNEPSILFVIFANIAVLLANIYPAIFAPLPVMTWVHLGVFGAYATLIPFAILFLSTLFARAPSITNIAPFQYTQIIWGILIGWIVFADIPNTHVLVGSALVIACGLYVLFHTARKNKKIRQSLANNEPL